MLKHLLTCLFFTSLLCDAQNLIPNGSFEELYECPQFLGDLTQAVNWHIARESPDLFNSCCTNNGWGVPYSEEFGFQYSQDGNGHAGMYTFYSFGDEVYRECITVPLLEAIDVGTPIYYSFYINRASGANNAVVDCASDNFGFKFTSEEYGQDIPVPIDNSSHWHLGSILMDSLNWTNISGQLTSDGSYTHLVFGNLYDNDNTEILDFEPETGCRAYYYIDNIIFSTSPIISKSENEGPNSLVVYPTIFNDKVIVETYTSNLIESLQLHASTGEIIKSQHSFPFAKFTIETLSLLPGLYFLVIQPKKGNPIIYKLQKL